METVPAAVTVAVEQGTLQVLEGGQEEGVELQRQQLDAVGGEGLKAATTAAGRVVVTAGDEVVVVAEAMAAAMVEGVVEQRQALAMQEVGMLVVQMAAGEPTAMAAQAAVGAGAVGAGGAMAVMVVIMRGVAPRLMQKVGLCRRHFRCSGQFQLLLLQRYWTALILLNSQCYGLPPPSTLPSHRNASSLAQHWQIQQHSFWHMHSTSLWMLYVNQIRRDEH